MIKWSINFNQYNWEISQLSLDNLHLHSEAYFTYNISYIYSLSQIKVFHWPNPEYNT